MSDNDKKASLMASLMGGDEGSGGGGGGGGADDDSDNNDKNKQPEQDLFGDVPIDDDDPPAPAPAPAPPSTNNNNNNSSSMTTGDHNNNYNNNSGNSNSNMANSESIYLDPMSGSTNNVGGNNSSTNNNSHNNNSHNNYYPYPQPPPQQTMTNAPNITFADNNTNNTNNNDNMTQSRPVLPSSTTDPSPPTTTTTTAAASKSLLMNSGLLGMTTTPSSGNDEGRGDNTTTGGGGGGGLFDDIDQEEEEKRAQQEEAARKARRQQEREAAAAAEQQKRQQEEAAAAAERQRLQQQPQQQQNQQRQPYSLEARMQGMHLKNQQQPGMMNQNQPQQGGQMDGQDQNQRQPQMQQPQVQPQMQQQGQQVTVNQSQMGSSSGNNNNAQQVPQQQPGGGQQHMMMNQNQQQPPQQQPPSHISVPGVMYRDHGGNVNVNNNNNMMQPGMNNGNMDNNNNNDPGPNRYYQPSAPGNVMAGLNNSMMAPQQQQQQQPGGPYGMISQQPQQQLQPQQRPHVPGQPIQITKPPDVPTYYGKVSVNDPMLLQAPSKLLGMVSSPPHWSYQFTTQIRGQPPSVWIVRRRFKHVVALEDRLRTECPGAVLPPRPDKHVSRAIEEASTHQSAEFAWQRAAELETYLNGLVCHPEVFASQALKMFLGLQDDMGTAWPEVSANAFTRMSALGASAASKVQETSTSGFFGGSGTAAPASTTPNHQSGGVMSNVMGQVASSVGVGDLTEAVTEDSAELLALSSSESVRMGAVLQAVPKLEGAVTLLREQGEGAGAVGMELNRLAKEVLSQGDRELAMPLEIFSNGLLRYGRRTKRLGQEIGQATMSSFQLQYKLCRYEKMAWGDRRNALNKRTKERAKADKRAQQLMAHQHQYPPRYGGPGGYGGGYGQPGMNQYNGGNQMDQMMTNATMSDNMAVDAVRECDEIGERLKREVNRISFSRRMDWAKSVKVIASYMKEAATERVAIWESTRDTFLQTFPDYHNDTAQWTNVAPSPEFQHQQQQQQQQQQQMPPQLMNMNNSYMAQPGMMMSQSYQQPQPPLQQQQQPQYNSMMGSAMVGSASAVGSGYQQQPH